MPNTSFPATAEGMPKFLSRSFLVGVPAVAPLGIVGQAQRGTVSNPAILRELQELLIFLPMMVKQYGPFTLIDKRLRAGLRKS